MRSISAVVFGLIVLWINGLSLAGGQEGFSRGGPKGFFVLNDDNGPQPLPEWVFKDEAIEGISLRLSWVDVEPEEGRFTFQYFDDHIERARKAGKKVMLRVYTGSRGHRIPDWVYQSRAARFEYGGSERMALPIPWGSVFLAEWTRLIKAMGQKYDREDAVVLVQMAGLDGTGGEMHLPKMPEDKKHWQEAGYSREKLVGAWKTVMDAYAEAFPGKFLAVDVSVPIQQDGVVEEVLAYAHSTLGNRLCVQHNALAAKTVVDGFPHKWVTSMRGKAIIGFQELCPVTPRGAFNDEGRRFGGTLEQALQIGMDAGMRYLEIYPVDMKNESLRPVIRDFSKRLENLE